MKDIVKLAIVILIFIIGLVVGYFIGDLIIGIANYVRPEDVIAYRIVSTLIEGVVWLYLSLSLFKSAVSMNEETRSILYAGAIVCLVALALIFILI